MPKPMASPKFHDAEGGVIRSTLPDQRAIAFEWVEAGVGQVTPSPVVLVLHGTPDSRLATPPNPMVPGVHQLLVDRPGFGDSDVDPDATPASVADDLAELCRQLGAERIGVMAWSAGTLFGLALAERHPTLAARLVLAAPLAPAVAWPEVAPERFEFDEDDIADIVPLLVPPGLDLAAAIDIALGADSDTRRREIDAVPGAALRLGQAVLASVRSGPVGLERDLAAQLVTPDLAAISTPCRVVVGADDDICPPAMGRWLADRLGSAEVTVEELSGAGHAFPMVRWHDLIRSAAGLA